MAEAIRLALIDDDDAVLDALRHFFARRTIVTSCFRTAGEFLKAIEPQQQFDCIVSDVRMPGMSGLELMRQLGQRSVALPVILITGHGDVDMAVAALKEGASDFIEKPFDEARLLASVVEAAEERWQNKSATAELDELQARFDALSGRQREVMELAVAGLSSKEIGLRLHISPKTVEHHRAWVMERVGAHNIADLVRKVLKMRSHLKARNSFSDEARGRPSIRPCGTLV
jgi:FixJ family two-component response regulator